MTGYNGIRSAVDMDGFTVMSREPFYQTLLHCTPSGYGGKKQRSQLTLPFRALPWASEVHAILFVHRVVGLPNGLYFLVRNEDHLDELRKATRSEFKWLKPDGCPDDLLLYELAQGDCQELSKRLSCHQDIASDGCFLLGMVARVELFWETGVLGQVLNLEAHAVGISATGIGCFVDPRSFLLQSADRPKERELLLGGGEESTIRRRNLQTKAGMTSTAESITESHRSSRQLMVQEVERSGSTLMTFGKFPKKFFWYYLHLGVVSYGSGSQGTESNQEPMVLLKKEPLVLFVREDPNRNRTVRFFWIWFRFYKLKFSNLINEAMVDSGW